MTSRTLRILLLLTAFGAVLSSTYVVFGTERAIQAANAHRAAFDLHARTTTAAIAQLGTAQQAYIAEGQGADYWMTRAADALAQVDHAIAELATTATAEPSRAAVQSAAGSLEQFRKLDRRAREYVGKGQGLMASDVIFTESLAALGAAARSVEIARAEEAADDDASEGSLRARQFYAAAGAGGVLLLVVLLLIPVPEPEVDVLTAMRALTVAAPVKTPVATARPKTETPVFDEAGSSARLISPPPSPSPAPPSPAPIPASAAAPAAVAPAPGPALSGIDLSTAARICSDLARVQDAGDISGLLGRAAEVLEAPGLIVWVSDRAGAVLYPLFTHGYPSHVILRLGTISAQANNATAAAWRAGELRSVDGDADVPGAIVAPIVTADGCVGVLAAEVRDARESRADVQALAEIFAAQLATVVTPVAAAAGESHVAQA